jgi:hypothetical protein
MSVLVTSPGDLEDRFGNAVADGEVVDGSFVLRSGTRPLVIRTGNRRWYVEWYEGKAFAELDVEGVSVAELQSILDLVIRVDRPAWQSAMKGVFRG